MTAETLVASGATAGFLAERSPGGLLLSLPRGAAGPPGPPYGGDPRGPGGAGAPRPTLLDFTLGAPGCVASCSLLCLALTRARSGSGSVGSKAPQNSATQISRSASSRSSSNAMASPRHGWCFRKTHSNLQMSFSISSTGGGDGTSTPKRCRPCSSEHSKLIMAETPSRPSSRPLHTRQSTAALASRLRRRDSKAAQVKTSYRLTWQPAGSVANKSKAVEADS